MFRFELPIALILLGLTPFMLFPSGVWMFWRRGRAETSRAQKSQGFGVASLDLVLSLPQSWRVRVGGPVLRLLQGVCYVLLVLALARPQSGGEFTDIEESGRDIMLTLDLSGSMNALDFKLDNQPVSRLQALQYVVKNFAEKRVGDRLGLVVFGDQVFTQCPLTSDREALKRYIDTLEVGMAGERTAIGDALAISLKRIKEIEATSKVIVLVSDGASNSGAMLPLEAASLAKKLSVKVHTVGIGSNGSAPMPVRDPFGRTVIQRVQVEYDEETLKAVAAVTGGQYFNARDTAGLQAVYDEIDKLEERQTKTTQYVAWEELYLYFVYLALALYFLQELLGATIFMRVPEY